MNFLPFLALCGLWCCFGCLFGRLTKRERVRYIVIDDLPPDVIVGVGGSETESRMMVLRTRHRILDEQCRGR